MLIPYHINLLSCIFLNNYPTFAVLQIVSFLILYGLVTPLIHLNILISATSNFLSCALFNAHVSVPYIIAGLTAVLHTFPLTLKLIHRSHFFFFRVLHTIFSHFRAHAFARSVTVARTSAVQASSSRRQERRWAITQIGHTEAPIPSSSYFPILIALYASSPHPSLHSLPMPLLAFAFSGSITQCSPFGLSLMFLHKLPQHKNCIRRPSTWHGTKLFIPDSYSP